MRVIYYSLGQLIILTCIFAGLSCLIVGLFVTVKFVYQLAAGL